MKYRAYDDPKKRAQSYGYMDNEYTDGIWEHEINYTTAPGTEWMWPRCFAVGGKTNFWGRSAARMGDIDFQCASLDGFDVNWPVKYEEIAPYYTGKRRLIGVASTVQNRPSNPDGDYIPPMNFRCFDWILQNRRGQGWCAVSAGSRSATDAGSITGIRLVTIAEIALKDVTSGVFLVAAIFVAGSGGDEESRHANKRAGEEYSGRCEGASGWSGVHRPE